MRSLFIGTLILLAIILAFSLHMYKLTSELSQELFSNLEQLKRAVEEEQWDKTALYLQQLNKSWNRADAWWTPLMDHRDLDHLDQTIVRIGGFIRQHCQEDALVEINVAKRLVERVRERESLSVRNIF